MEILDVRGYYHLPPDIRAAVDEWGEREGLWGCVDRGLLIRALCFPGEGVVDAECLVVENGHIKMVDGEIATEWRRFKLRTPPPVSLLRLLLT